MFNVIKSTSSVSLPPRPLPSFLEAYTYLAACLLQYEHVRTRQGDGGGWGIWVVLLLVVVRRGGGGGGGGKAWVNKGRWEKKKETSEAIISGRAVAVSLGVWMCVRVCVFSLFFFCNFIQFGRSRRSARANNSLQTADVITFWQTSQSGVTFAVLKHTLTSLSASRCIYSTLPLIPEQKSPGADDVWVYYGDLTTRNVQFA